MTPIQAIEGLPELLKQFNKRQWSIDAEADSIREEWEGLGNAGGQREDHAARLLARLRPALAELSRFASVCEKQIDGFVADPFGTKAA